MNQFQSKISLKELKKSFQIGTMRADGFLSHLLSSLSGRENKKKIDVIKNISLEIATGEIVGIIGSNGSGKSTLLRLIADIYQPDSGQIKCGRDAIYINGYSIGLRPRLTMRENIFLTAAIMGLTRRETKERFQEIVDFAELKEFTETKISQFSYGMMHRLSFSIIIHVLKQKKPEAVLLDEVFGAGGDLDFQYKEANKMKEFTQSGAAVLLVSHNLEIVKDYCQRVIWLEDGAIKLEGAPNVVVNRYIKSGQK